MLTASLMLFDAREHPGDSSPLRAEVCVIGSGAAGTTVALELVRSGVDVVLLEGGGLKVEPAAQDTYAGLLVDGTAHDPLELVRQKRLGGTTWQWGGRCMPLDAIDFDFRSWIPHSGWPIDRDELLPYYTRAHSYCDLGAFDYDARSALPSAATFVVGDEESTLTDTKLWRWSPPVKFGRRFRRILAGNSRVRVFHHANVVRLERDVLSGRAVRAVATAGPGRELQVDALAFVLAVGGLESARLLLASNEQTPAGIGNEYDQVGRYYMTHPVAEVGRVTFHHPERLAAGQFLRTRDDVYCRRIIALTESAQRQLEVRNMAVALWYPDPRDPTHGDALLSAFALVRATMARSMLDWKSTGVHRRYGEIVDIPAHIRNVGRDLSLVTRYGSTWVRRRWIAHRALPSFMVSTTRVPMRFRFDAEQSPEPQNRVTLGRERDRLGVPRLELRYRVGQDDRESMFRCLAAIRDELARLGVANVAVPMQEVFSELPFGDGTHQMGVTRMSNSPREGAVDPCCRVHGARNLWVASSAVFPTSGVAGPTLTIVALALRIADAVRREVRPAAGQTKQPRASRSAAPRSDQSKREAQAE